MRYARYGDILTPDWTVQTGTARTGYEAANLEAIDPSLPCWIAENTIRVIADLGAAAPVAAVALIGHTFQESLSVLVEANDTYDIVVPALSHVITIEPPYRDGYKCHALLDLTTLYAEMDRTFRYWSVTNIGDANDVSVAIGNVLLLSAWRTLDPSIAHAYQRPQQHFVSRQSSKRGVQMVYDLGSRNRQLVGKMNGITTADLDTVLDWCDEQHQTARPMLIQLDENSTSVRGREPHLARFIQAVTTPVTRFHEIAYDVDLQFEEMGAGELLGA